MARSFTWLTLRGCSVTPPGLQQRIRCRRNRGTNHAAAASSPSGDVAGLAWQQFLPPTIPGTMPFGAALILGSRVQAGRWLAARAVCFCFFSFTGYVLTSGCTELCLANFSVIDFAVFLGAFSYKSSSAIVFICIRVRS